MVESGPSAYRRHVSVKRHSFMFALSRTTGAERYKDQTSSSLARGNLSCSRSEFGMNHHEAGISLPVARSRCRENFVHCLNIVDLVAPEKTELLGATPGQLPSAERLSTVRLPAVGVGLHDTHRALIVETDQPSLRDCLAN